MNDLLNRIFGLEGTGFGSEGTRLELARPIAAWGWALIVLGAGALAWWSYSRLAAPRRARWTLAGLRVVLLLLLVTALAGPQLTRANERIEKDWLLVLVDRSSSMGIPDAPGPTTRDAQLEAALSQAWPAWTELARERRVLWMGFGGGAFDLAARDDALDLGPADGRRTNIGAAIDAALARAAARPVCGVVILSDGRSMDELTRTARRRLEGEQIPVFAVPLGSPDPIADLAIASAEAPRLAFADDTLPVTVEIDRLGPADAGGSPGVVRLIEASTGILIDEVPLPDSPDAWESGRARVVLSTRPREPGARRYLVRVVPADRDLSDANNQGEVSIEVVDRPLRVAVFDGYPRWESRYLKNLLVRERSISGVSLILAANRRYLPEGAIELRSLPRSTEDWARFDVVVIGDVRPELFGDDSLSALRQTVAERGAGLLWLAGSGATPRAWRDSPLADLLPFSLAGAGGVGEHEGPVLVERTPLAERLGVLALGDSLADPWPASLADPDAGWSALRWCQRIDASAVKPTAEVIAVARPIGAESPGTPLVLSMRYGAGRVLYVASDEIWRWRYARGETLPERFWLPLLRMQGRESLARTGRPAAIGATPRRPLVGQPVRVWVELLDQSLVDQAPASIPARITAPGDPSFAPITLSLAPDQPDAGSPTTRDYAAAWIPDTPGAYRVEAGSPLLVGLDLRAEVEVMVPDDEFRRPEADHALLASLTQISGGAVVTPDRLADVPTLLPRREVRILAAPEVRTLWDRPIVLASLLVVMTLEWIGRRLIKLA